MENCTAILCSSGLLRDTDKTILSFSLRPEYMYKKTGPHAAAYISDAGCLYYGQFRNHYPAWRIYYSVFCLQSDAAAYFCLICSAAAAESILEISCGIQAVCSFFFGASSVRLAAVCSCASFGGLCIFAQTKSVLCHAGIRIRSFTVGRLFLALLSFLLFLLLQKLSPVPVPGGY